MLVEGWKINVGIFCCANIDDCILKSPVTIVFPPQKGGYKANSKKVCVMYFVMWGLGKNQLEAEIQCLSRLY